MPGDGSAPVCVTSEDGGDGEQKLLILSNSEAMSLNQGQLCTVSPIRNLPSPQHKHTSTFFTITETLRDGECLSKRGMNLELLHEDIILVTRVTQYVAVDTAGTLS